MPRKEFQKDLAQASVPGRFPRLQNIRAGEEHGSVLFTYTVPFCNQTIDLQTSILDTYDYPDDHTYFTFAASDSIPEAVSKALETLRPTFAGLTIQEFLECICDSIDDALLGVDCEPDRYQCVFTESESPSDDDVDWEVDYGTVSTQVMDRSDVTRRIQSDMRAVKQAGYRVGFIGTLTESFILSISCRIAKLGISSVAMKAWNVRPSQYLVLLLRYPLGYRQLEDIILRSTPRIPLIRMHVGLCDSYKPSRTSAIQAFDFTAAKTPGIVHNEGPPLQSFFIGDSLHTLLNTHFINLVRHRLQNNFTWTGAELYFKNGQAEILGSEELTREVYFVPEVWNCTTPQFLKDDHILEGGTQLSLPLITVQFMLRRFVKCTEFCLNCYCKVDAGFEALMPYVCSNSLCLYQYMKLGMGPSLEWEIVSQPYVVDMLVSFTYSRAICGRLEDFPTGLGIGVPTAYDKKSHLGGCFGKLHLRRMELLAERQHDLRVGDWIVILPCGADIRSGRYQWHCRVQHADSLSVIHISSPVTRGVLSNPKMEFKDMDRVQFVRYRGCFDNLTNYAKCEAIVMLLDTLPDINAMRSFILSHPNANSKRPLMSWCERISPSALYVLRWILASNRSCIRYEDDPEHQISGLRGYAQFRLTQGAPDKEQRFVTAVKSQSGCDPKQHPTLFAWHGSPLFNWHSILREGLHFKHIAHGRASGNGVYMSLNFDYSLAYTSPASSIQTWPNSALNINAALSLNEVVNAPEQFVCNTGYYVVDKLDWIQPRYLIIGYKNKSLSLGEAGDKPSVVYCQDPEYCAVGPGNTALTLPISAISSHQSQHYSDVSNPQARRSNGHRKMLRNGRSGEQRPEEALVLSDEDLDSVATLADDCWLLESDTKDSNDSYDKTSKEARCDLSKTNFRPGSLEESSLKLLGPPKYATSLATRSLQKHLQATLKSQERESLHALGWYIDPKLISNVYQWIVQLHSFEASLPLARDLEAARLTAVVLELRFPPQFPMSPPFVRVIRPRFLPFSQGGGGHVTAGGAMCMELLTSSGWSPASSMESVLLQVRMALTNMEPVPARLDHLHTQDYTVAEAVSAYTRVCRMHGWKIPDDLIQVSW
ncbi:hypothetical protein BDV28DRAFT_145438 [Aspergillus coremiiformis]|uniref:UBC core domain-containing protein n=1 Tax=Aspergillus coremiiformis TaxID=138285 RepID=A0A5N6ZF04_9EURO|nr:hypothetical protein BDV28DRAFT_145438 [Aspergillus coremiiformis]